MKLNAKEEIVLASVLADRNRQAGLDYNGDGISRDRLGAYRLHIENAQAGYVRVNLAEWIGHAPSPSEAVMFHRAYKRLEALGLLERTNLYGYSERTSHLRLTESGEAIARRLLKLETSR